MRSGDEHTAIVRLEQLYPLDAEQLGEALAPFGDAETVWVQEEPANQGAWTYLTQALPPELARRVRLVSRPASASPAAGSSKKHATEQAALVEAAFAR